MSKKWGTNPKVEQKRQKQKTQKQATQNKKAQKIESEKWKDQETDKFKEKQRQKQREKEQQQRKRDEKKKLVEQEQKQMAKINKKVYVTEKMTVAEINKKQEQLAKQQQQNSDDSQIQDIYNDIDDDLVNAHTIQQALSQLDLQTVDKHPQKRMKAAWIKYVDDNLSRIKKQNTGMKRSQHLNLLRQQWKKAPQNPYNRNIVTYNTKI